MIPVMYPTTTTVVNFVAFGAAADLINMLKPSMIIFDGGGNMEVSETNALANYVSEWSIGNNSELAFMNPSSDLASVGASALGPDGTMTANKIVESSGNTPHCMRAGLKWSSTGSVDKAMAYRLVVYAKAGERSRFQLELANSQIPFANPTRSGGVRATFDVSAGTIATAAAIFGNMAGALATAPVAAIEASQDGWYKCSVECMFPDTPFSGFPIGPFCTIFLDNGSGTTYAGDGASGMYFWQSRLLPPRAFNLTERTFFDDFNSLDTIDVDDTKAPGFNWYVDNESPAWPFGTIPAGEYSIAGSILTISSPSSLANKTLTSSVWSGTAFGVTPVSGSWTGFHFNMPALVEARAYWGDAPGGASGWPSTWTNSRELFEYPAVFNSAVGGVDAIFHPDYSSAGILHPTANAAAGTSVVTFAYVPPWGRRVGAFCWGTGIASGTKILSANSTTITLDANIVAPGVSIGQDFYVGWATEHDFFEVTVAPSGSPNSKPYTGVHGYPTHITQFTGSAGEISGLDPDYTQPHTYQTLLLPYDGTDIGLRLHFTDGLCQPIPTWQFAPDLTSGIFAWDDGTADYPIWIGAPNDFPGSWDFVAVYE